MQLTKRAAQAKLATRNHIGNAVRYLARYGWQLRDVHHPMANYVMALQEEERKAARPIGAKTKPKAKTVNLENGLSVEEEYMIGEERHATARALEREKWAQRKGKDGWAIRRRSRNM